MANTYSQIYLQFVFAVKGREHIILPSFEENLYKYVTGIITKLGHKMIAINGMPNHIHIFVGMKPNMSPSDLVNKIKTNSSKFVNEEGFLRGHFEWQTGYGVFSYGQSQIDSVYKYILNQKEHHKTRNFKEEYLGLLKVFEIEYNDQYLFDFLD